MRGPMPPEPWQLSSKPSSAHSQANCVGFFSAQTREGGPRRRFAVPFVRLNVLTLRDVKFGPGGTSTFEHHF
jgi:hypothetical protein